MGDLHAVNDGRGAWCPTCRRSPRRTTMANPTSIRPRLGQPLVTAQQLAELLAVSPRSLRRLVATGRCPKPIRLGGAARWHLQRIETWLRAGCPPVRTR